MYLPTVIPSFTAAKLCAVAFFSGVQTGLRGEPVFELWTLRKDLSPALLAGSTVRRDKITVALGLSAF